jgi:protein involved in plasmid replication-relaxation
MISNLTQQRTLRGHKPTRPTPRAANTADHQAVLASRLTPRDRWIIRMLWEHRVLTAHQITALAFPSFRSGRQRLRELFQWAVVDRFQPFVTCGTAPMHYVLAPAGASVLAAEDGLDVKDLGYRHDRAFAVAHSLRLAHTVGVAEWFTALIARARHSDPHEHTELAAWWSEARCTRHFGDLIKPDAYGRWTNNGVQIEFFLEYDLGTEALAKLAGKLAGYAALAEATGIVTPLLVWLPTARREAAARGVLHRTWRDLNNPPAVPVATAAAELLNPEAAHPSSADQVWLPLDSHGSIGVRQELHRLLHAWPQILAPTVDSEPLATTEAMPASSSLSMVPPPSPMPPAPADARLARPSTATR